MKLFLVGYGCNNNEITADVKKAFIQDVDVSNGVTNLMVLFEDGEARLFSFPGYKECSSCEQVNLALQYLRNGIEDGEKILDFSERCRFFKEKEPYENIIHYSIE